MDKFSMRVCGIDVIAYKRPGEPWTDGAARAVRRAMNGKGWAYGWIEDGREYADYPDGYRMWRLHFKATVTGPANRDGSRPILGEARAIVPDELTELG